MKKRKFKVLYYLSLFLFLLYIILSFAKAPIDKIYLDILYIIPAISIITYHYLNRHTNEKD